jgi:hypothetical protein
MTPASGAVTSVAVTEPPAARSVSEGLGQARTHWSDADIESYRFTVAENLNFWSAGCTWVTVVSEGAVTEMDVTETPADPAACVPIEWTVEQLHEMIAGWLDDVHQFPSAEFGEHTLAVEFDDDGVPVALEFDLANGADEESSMRVTFTPLP